MKAEERKDLRLELRVKNNALYQAIQGAHGSVSAFCQKHNLTAGARHGIYKLLSFNGSPVDKTGAWKPIVVKVAKALKGEPDELFPRYLYEKIKEPKRVLEISSFTALPGAVRQAVALLPAPQEPVETEMLKQEQLDAIKAALPMLTYREREAVKRYFALSDEPKLSQREIGNQWKLSHTRAGQVLHRALRKLQGRLRTAHPGLFPAEKECAICLHAGKREAQPEAWELTWLDQLKASCPAQLAGIGTTDALATIRRVLSSFGGAFDRLTPAEQYTLRHRYGLDCGSAHRIEAIVSQYGASVAAIRIRLQGAMDCLLWQYRGRIIRRFEQLPFGIQYRLDHDDWRAMHALSEALSENQRCLVPRSWDSPMAYLNEVLRDDPKDPQVLALQTYYAAEAYLVGQRDKSQLHRELVSAVANKLSLPETTAWGRLNGLIGKLGLPAEQP